MRRPAILAVLAVFAALSASAAAATKPSKSGCAVAWNRSAPASLTSSIVADHPRGAFIDNATTFGMDWTKGGKSTTTQSEGCSIQFILHNGRTLSVFGAWANGNVATWSGPVPSNGPIPVPNNTNVHTDGTVGFHG